MPSFETAVEPNVDANSGNDRTDEGCFLVWIAMWIIALAVLLPAFT